LKQGKTLLYRWLLVPIDDGPSGGTGLIAGRCFWDHDRSLGDGDLL